MQNPQCYFKVLPIPLKNNFLSKNNKTANYALKKKRKKNGGHVIPNLRLFKK